MYKLKNLLWIALAAVIAGCSGQGAATPTTAPTKPALVTATPSAATKAAPAATAPSGAISLTPVGVASAPKLDPAGMCKATGAPKPVPNFSNSLPTDEVRGQANAPLTLYEYSDFQ